MRVAYMEIYSEKICDLLVGTEGLDLKEYNVSRVKNHGKNTSLLGLPKY